MSIPLTCLERGDKRQLKLGVNASGSSEWIISGTNSEVVALQMLYAAAPQLVNWNISGWVTFTGYFVDAHVEQESDIVWKGIVTYGDPTNNTAAQPIGWSVMDFEIGGKEIKLMYGLDAVEADYVTSPTVKENFNNAINPDENDNPQGVDVQTATARFSVTQIFAPSSITDTYVLQVCSVLNNPVNNNDFYFYNAISHQVMFHAQTGELRIAGAVGRQRSQDKFEMTFRFEYQPNCDGTTQPTITVGTGATAIISITKLGWQNLFVRWKPGQDPNSKGSVPVPQQVVVNTVQGVSDFTTLGIGLEAPPV